MDRRNRDTVMQRVHGPVMQRVQGPVIERANEPGLPRGLVRLFILGAIVAAAYAGGYLPDRQRIERGWNDMTAMVQDFTGSFSSSSPPPPPPQTASRSTPPAQGPRPSPPVSRPQSPAPTAPDPFREAFNRNVIGQIPASPAPSSPPARQPVSREASPPLPPAVPPVVVPPPAPVDAARPDAGNPSNVASAPPPVSPPPPPPRPESDSIFPRPPGATPATAPFSPEALDRMVQLELSAFNSSRDVPAKRAAMQRIAAAAQLGHGPARGLIARSYPASTIIRDIVPQADAVRFALDFIIFKRAFSTDARRDFIALAAWFDGERRDAAFGKAVFDAIRDDPRLQTPQASDDLMFLLFRAERGCIALRRHIDVFDPSTTNMGHCGRDLVTATPEKARAAGAAGLEAKGFREAVDTLRNVVSE